MTKWLIVVLLVFGAIPATAGDTPFLPGLDPGPSGTGIWDSAQWQRVFVVAPGIRFRTGPDLYGRDAFAQRLEPVIGPQSLTYVRDLRTVLDVMRVCPDTRLACRAQVVLQVFSSTEVNAEPDASARAAVRATWIGEQGKQFDCYGQMLASDGGVMRIWQLLVPGVWTQPDTGPAAEMCGASITVAMAVMQTQSFWE